MIAEWWGKSMGSDMEQLRRVSPLRHADKVRIPILLLHGVEDSVVPIEQSRAMNAKLQRAKRNVKYKELGVDDHWLSSASTRTMMLQELETFLAESLSR
jgi:dipeptidyl aminopeptidase/acylaminoacyl peptidase